MQGILAAALCGLKEIDCKWRELQVDRLDTNQTRCDCSTQQTSTSYR